MYMSKYRHIFLVVLVLALLVGCSGKSPRSSSVPSTKAQGIVDDCTETFREQLEGEQGDELKRAVAQAQGVLILDGLGDVSFFFSVGGGTAVLFAKTNEGWTGPVFLGKATGGIGIQAGVTKTSGAMVYMSEEDVRYMLETGAVLQGRAAITFLNKDYEKNRTQEFYEEGDVIFIGENSGLYAGAGVRGGGLGNREQLNEDYHGVADGNPEEILYEKKSMPAGASHLRDLLEMAAAGAKDVPAPKSQGFFIIEETKKDGTEVPSN